MRANGTSANAFLHGKVEGKRSRGSSARQWLDDAKELIDRTELE